MATRGAISIEVVADTAKFAADAKSQINSALKSVKVPPVKIDGDVKPLQEKVKETLDKATFEDLGEKAGQSFSEGFTRDAAGRLRDSRGKFIKESELLGGASGKGFQSGFGSVIGSTFQNSLSSAISSVQTAVGPAVAALGSTIGAVLAAALAPVVISGIAAAITVGGALAAGAGIIGIAAIALKENERLVDEAKNTVDTIKSVFAQAAQPLVQPFSNALGEIRKVVKSLQPDLKALFAGVAPSISSLTAAIGPTLKPILDGLKSALPGINAAFSGLAKALPVVGEAIGKFFGTIFKDGPVIETLTRNLGTFVAWLISVAGPAIRVLTVLFGAFVNAIRVTGKGLAEAWEQIKAAFDGGSGAIARLTAAWAPLKEAIFAVWDALKQFAAAQTDEELAASMMNLIQRIKDLWGPLKEFISVIWDEVWAAVIRIWNDKVVPWWEGTAKPFLESQVRSFVVGIFSSMVSQAVGVLASLPGRAVGALYSLGGAIRGAIFNAVAGAAGWLYGAGQNIVQGLINGVYSMIGRLAGAVSSAVQTIRNYLPFSPAKVGPLSGDGSPESSGRKIAIGVADGIKAEQSAISSAMNTMATSLQPSTPAMGAFNAGAGDPATGGGIRVWPGQAQVEPDPLVINSGGSKMDDLLVEVLSKAVRIRGGDVQKVLGKTSAGVS